MKIKLTKIISTILVSTLVFVSCGTNNNETEEVKDDKLTIVTSFYPVYISTINVVKDIPNVEVINMTKPQTGCLHDYELTPEDLKTIEKADVFIANGAGMESFLDKVISNNKNMKVIEASEGIELLSSDEEHNHENDSHDHEHESENGHVWVSVSNAIDQVENIADELSEIDKDNEASYIKNSEEYIAKLDTLRTDIHTGLDNIKNKDIVTFHESFSYFAEEFDLNIVAGINVEPDTAELPAKKREEIISIVKDHNIKVLFTEPQYDYKFIDNIASETGAKLYKIDPIVTGDATKDAHDDYINKMRENLKIIEEALK